MKRMEAADAIYDIDVTRIDGTPVRMDTWRGQALLIVNVASMCGLTPQYEGLEALYRRYRDRGFVVLGFPCDQFGHQEPGTEAEIQAFCAAKYDVTFPLFHKIAVNGAEVHPLFELLKSSKTGVLGSTAIKWNFTKFLVARNGEVLKRFAPTDTPEVLEGDIQAALTETMPERSR